MKLTILIACVGLCFGAPGKSAPTAGNDGATNMWNLHEFCPAYGSSQRGAQVNWDWTVSICQNSTALWGELRAAQAAIQINTENIAALTARVGDVEVLAREAKDAAKENAEDIAELQSAIASSQTATGASISDLLARVQDLESRLAELGSCCNGGDSGSSSSGGGSGSSGGATEGTVQCPVCAPGAGDNGIGGTLEQCLLKTKETCGSDQDCEGSYSASKAGWKFSCKTSSACKDDHTTGDSANSWKEFCCGASDGCDSATYWTSRLGP